MRRLSIACALAAVLAGAASLPAAELHVSVEGSDTNDGSAERPWRTIQHAVDRAQPGDTIVVHAGTYAGARIERSGTRRQPIRLESVLFEPVELDRPGTEARHGGILEVESFGETVHDWVIRGFRIVGAPRSGIDIRNAKRIVVVGNSVSGSGRSGIFTAFADRVTIDRNLSFDNGEHGIYCSNSGDRPKVVRNHLYDNAASGVHMNGDLSQGGDGTISRATIARNVTSGNGRLGGSGINLDGVERSRIVNNVLFHEHASGISLFRQDGAICSSRNRIFHNTVWVAEDGRWAFNMPDAGCTGNRLVNNVLWTDHPWRGSVAIFAPRPAGFVERHNAFGDRFSVDGGESRIDFAAWRRLGHGEGSLVTTRDEWFDERGDPDFAPRPGGALDRGAPLRSVRRDVVGTRRPQGAGWDIGAKEVFVGRSSGSGPD